MKIFDGDYEKLGDYDAAITCTNCGRTWVVSVTEEDLERLRAWERREILIQDALPNHDMYERELIRYDISGLPMIACCEECRIENWGY